MAFMNYKGFSKSSDPYGTGNNIRQKNIDGSFDRGDRTQVDQSAVDEDKGFIT